MITERFFDIKFLICIAIFYYIYAAKVIDMYQV